MKAALRDVDMVAFVDDVRAGEVSPRLRFKLPHTLPLCRNKVSRIAGKVIGIRHATDKRVAAHGPASRRHAPEGEG